MLVLLVAPCLYYQQGSLRVRVRVAGGLVLLYLGQVNFPYPASVGLIVLTLSKQLSWLTPRASASCWKSIVDNVNNGQSGSRRVRGASSRHDHRDNCPVTGASNRYDHRNGCRQYDNSRIEPFMTWKSFGRRIHFQPAASGRVDAVASGVWCQLSPKHHRQKLLIQAF
jgi:hypothetical protein